MDIFKSYLIAKCNYENKLKELEIEKKKLEDKLKIKEFKDDYSLTKNEITEYIKTLNFGEPKSFEEDYCLERGDLRDKYGLYDENCIELWDSIRDINAYIHIDLEKITMYKEYEECMDDYDGVNYTIKRFEVYEYDLV